MSLRLSTSVCLNTSRKKNSNTKNSPPTPNISPYMGRVRMKAWRSRGRSCITLSDGGSEARAMAAKVSIIRFIHSICVTVSGDSVPMKAPMSTMRHAVTLTVSWNSRNRCMF